MLRTPIRLKLIAGLSLVIVMMMILMGGSTFGLHAFHSSNLKLVDLLPELGESKVLLQVVVRLSALRAASSEKSPVFESTLLEARETLARYYQVLKKNALRGNRADDGRDEAEIAYHIDADLTALLAEVRGDPAIEPVIPATRAYLKSHATEVAVARDPALAFQQRIDRLGQTVVKLPDVLHHDFFAVLENSKQQYVTSRVIVWTSALMVLGMLIALARLCHRWVLYPVRLLQRGVRRVARGQFDYHIELKSGDEMQALAEAFNDMTTQLSATYSDLERQVQERSRMLVRSERLAGVGFLAAGVAHEINNPLASIAFCSEALENRIGGILAGSESGDAKLVSSYLRMIQEEAFRCKRITEKLLDFARCNEIQRARTDLVELIQSVVEMLTHMGKYRAKNIVFQPREAVLAHVDAQEIKQVILNLMVNALDSMEPAGTLRIELRQSSGVAEMAFADDGCGMPADVLENIFEPFFTRRRVGTGTGLGLSISHRIISQHHGEIRAESPGEGHGSTFTVRLPVRPPDPAPLVSESKSDAAVSESRAA